jgi:hypothetical protein
LLLLLRPRFFPLLWGLSVLDSHFELIIYWSTRSFYKTSHWIRTSVQGKPLTCTLTMLPWNGSSRLNIMLPCNQNKLMQNT